MSECAYIAVGSNIDPEHNVAAALERLGRRQRILAVSSFYWTPALGAAGADAPAAPDFLNGVVAIETPLEPAELKRLLQEIEDELGRRRSPDRNAPRTIDLDLILQGERVLSGEEPESGGLVLPSPEILERPFVGLPLLEIAPDLALPRAGRPLRELAQGLSSSQMRPADQFNEHLRGVERSRE